MEILISSLSTYVHHGKNEYDFQAQCLFQRHIFRTHVLLYILKVPSHPVSLHFQLWILYALWSISHCGIVVMVTRFRILKQHLAVRDTQWDFNRVHCSDRLVIQWSNKGGLNCGCCWQLERGICYALRPFWGPRTLTQGFLFQIVSLLNGGHKSDSCSCCENLF